MGASSRSSVTGRLHSRVIPVEIGVVAGAAYLLILLCIWGPFATSSGMPYETAFPYMSDISHAGSGFLYLADPLRKFTNVFYHLSYLIGDWIGMRGSFAPYQFVYAALWWGRAILIFLIVGHLVRGSAILPYVSGAFALLHASDGALQWVGQMNQFGFIFWLLLAMYLFVLALKKDTFGEARLLIGAAALFEYLSLWSYESPLFIMLVAPVLLLFAIRPKSMPTGIALSAIWYTVPGGYLVSTFGRYLTTAGKNTYQAGVMRHSWAPSELLADLLVNIRYSVCFWSWVPKESHIPDSQIVALAAGTLTIFVVAGAILTRIAVQRKQLEDLHPSPHPWRMLILGIVLLVCSFPAYLALGGSRSMYRTQFLSGIGTAMIWGTVLVIASYLIRPKIWQAAVIITMCLPFVWTGARRAIEAGGFHRSIWDKHLFAVREVARIAPQVHPDTIVVMTGVPKSDDPFGDNYWFDMAVRLLYTRETVAGLYYYADGTRAPGDNLRLQGSEWEWDGTGVPPLIRSAAVDHTLAIQFQPSGTASIVNALPPYVCAGTCDLQNYRPMARISGRILTAEAWSRYGPF